MQKTYQEILNYMRDSGKRIKAKAGEITDIGVAKQWLTEEDIAIERGLKNIIASLGSDHVLYSEEENFNFTESKHLWIADPISNTRSFIKGLPHYAIVVSYVENGVIVFSAVYDPSTDDMYTAYKNKGTFLNNKQIFIKETKEKPRLILNISSVGWDTHPILPELFKLSDKYSVFRNTASFAINYGYLAAGRFDVCISLVKDVFPEYAGSLIIKEAGGDFKTITNGQNIKLTDRVFVSGLQKYVKELLPYLTEQLNPNDDVFKLTGGKL